MAKRPTTTTVASGFYSTTTLNNNFTALRDAFDNTLSLDGSTPNAMNADLDMNSNDILNVGEIDVQGLTIDGVAVYPGSTQLATTYATQSYTGNGSTVTYAMGFNPSTKANVDVYIDGVYQNQDAFNISGTNLTFTAAPPLNSAIEIKVPVNLTSLVASDSQQITYNQGGAGSVTRTVQSRLRDFVSVKDFGAVGDWNGTQSSPGTGTDDTAAIQAAIDYCVANGTRLYFEQGRYRTTAPLVIDKTAYTNDPINGDMSGFSIEGGGARSAQIVADHDGVCLDYRGGSSAGIHSYLNISGVGLLKGNYDRAAGSVGLKLNLCAYFSINRFDMYGFEYGIYGVDCLSGSFEDGTIRGNEHGFYFIKGVSSHPNNISFRGVMTLNNRTTGGNLIKPSVFSYIGGSIESNGYTGVLADPNSWGLYVESAGTEGAVGVNMQGVYIENNNGKADVWILQTSNQAIHNFDGCSFLRFQSTRYVTSCILFNSTNDSRLTISGCGFKDYAPYVSDPSRLFIAAGDAQVFDGGSNFFFDTTGGYTGVARAVFAPLGINHQTQFSALPDVAEYRNGIQYCADGTGSSLPALAVSDGVRWNQIPLGQFSGRVASAGTALRLPRGWTCSKTGTGVYVITHNLGLAANTYSVIATPSGSPGTGYCSGMALSGNTFEIYFANTSGSAANMDFNFNMQIV